MLLGDGVYDRLTSSDVIDTIWQTVRYYASEEPELSYEKILTESVNNVLRRAMIQQSEDNLTFMIVCFKNLLQA